MDMRFDTLIDSVNAAHTIITEKGWYAYNHNIFSVDGDGMCIFSMTIRPPYSSTYDNDWSSDENITIKESCSRLEDVRGCMNRFHDAVARHPSIDDYMRGRYRQRLVDLAAEGERLGFALEYVEVLRSTAKALATNALQDHSKTAL
jgi:hypothetical protein